MNLTLTRTQTRSDGIFGTLTDEQGQEIAVTLEHAYPQSDGSYLPKVVAGIYTCVLHPPNRLPYVTYMLENVPDFMGQPVSGILIHKGNYNNDSVGCILVGTSIKAPAIPSMDQIISQSQAAFQKLMALQSGLNSFTLTIKESHEA